MRQEKLRQEVIRRWEGQLLADFVEKVGIQTGWNSDAASLIEGGSAVRCILRAFSGSLGHLRLW
jgi:hypothetical protein